MGLFDKLREPVVLKEDSSAKKQLEQLDFYSKLAPESVKEQIEQDKKLVYYGIKGEEALMFELKTVICLCIFFTIFSLKKMDLQRR